MSAAALLKRQIEASLADRIPAALTPAAKTIREVMATGVPELDEVLEGGLPVGAVTEMMGAECTGRTAVALSLVARATRAERVCAWVDVSDTLSPESAAAAGVELRRMLWVRCGVRWGERGEAAGGQARFVLPTRYLVPAPGIRGLHGGGFGPHPRSEERGLAAGVGELLRMDALGSLGKDTQRNVRAEGKGLATDAARGFVRGDALAARGKACTRVEQALRVTDLLLQGGGFAAIVLDLGSVAPEQVLCIPAATWFRYRAAAARTRTSVVLVTQHACAKSSAGLVLRFEGGEVRAGASTVLEGFERRVQVLRQRFAETEAKVVPLRKPLQRATGAAWRSGMTWAR